MLFDWFTVFAQIANFLILMWLLKKLLYRPILDAIDAREKRIANLLQETELSQKQMEEQRTQLATKNEAFAKERETLLLQAKLEAETLKKQMIETASLEVNQQRTQWLASLQKEQENLEHDISQRTQQEVFNVARKALLDLSDVELEMQITHVFIKQLEQLSPQQRQQFSTSAPSELIIRSAMGLSDQNKEVLQQAVSKVFSTQLPLHFEHDSELIGGIELKGSGHKMSWNIDDYLSDLEDSIANIVNNKVKQSVSQSSHSAKGVTSV